jgi:2-oxoglutarate dehydrogenase E1 component
MKKKILDQMHEANAKSKTHSYEFEDWISEEWKKVHQLDQKVAPMTGVPKTKLQEIGQKITVLPKDAEFHRLVRKIFDQRAANIESGKDIDWGTAEALAFATLIQEGFHVRISGQDVERGTFSHRHAHVFYQDQPGYYNPINNVVENEGS